jgi:hypothetical protein
MSNTIDQKIKTYLEILDATETDLVAIGSLHTTKDEHKYNSEEDDTVPSTSEEEEEEEVQKKRKMSQLSSKRAKTDESALDTLKRNFIRATDTGIVEVSAYGMQSLIVVNNQALNRYNLKSLMALATPSPYGDLKTGETKHDPSVRVAFELKTNVDPDKISVYRDGDVHLRVSRKWDEYVGSIIKKLSRIFTGDIELRISKLNIYLKGGFFKPHQDTPKPGVIGSCVIVLPTAYTGGVFRVTDLNSTTHGYSNGGIPGECDEDTPLFLDDNSLVVGFHPHLIHEVAEVKSGVRISVTFDVIAKENSIVKSDPVPFHGALEEYINKTKKPIGVVLSSKYSFDEINQGTFKKDSTYDMLLTSTPPESVSRFAVPVFLKHKAVRYLDENEYAEYSIKVCACKTLHEYPPQILELEDVPFIGLHYKCTLLASHDAKGAEHTGNEARPEKQKNLYYSVALVFIPNK